MKHKYNKGKVLYFINWTGYTHTFKIKSKIQKCTILKRIEVSGFSELWYAVTESGYGYYFTIREDHLYETEAEAKKDVLKGLKESLKELDEKYLDLKMRIEDEIKNQSTDERIETKKCCDTCTATPKHELGKPFVVCRIRGKEEQSSSICHLYQQRPDTDLLTK